jgi:hypothetical protein
MSITKRKRAQPTELDSGVLQLGDGGEVELRRRVFNSAAQGMFDRLRRLDWGSPKMIKIMGKLVAQPRLVLYQGDPHTAYTYSGIENIPEPWSEVVQEIKVRAWCTPPPPAALRRRSRAAIVRTGAGRGCHKLLVRQLSPELVPRRRGLHGLA